MHLVALRTTSSATLTSPLSSCSLQEHVPAKNQFMLVENPRYEVLSFESPKSCKSSLKATSAAETSDGSALYVIAVTENRHREVGVAAVSLKRQRVICPTIIL
jgi:hypothetical protein